MDVPLKTIDVPEELIVHVLREAENSKNVFSVCEEYGIGVSTFYKWRRKYQGMNTKEIMKHKNLEKEIKFLQKQNRELQEENTLLKELFVKKY
jgi:putative transposase